MQTISGGHLQRCPNLIKFCDEEVLARARRAS
jgi:hypothetical protein